MWCWWWRRRRTWGWGWGWGVIALAARKHAYIVGIVRKIKCQTVSGTYCSKRGLPPLLQVPPENLSNANQSAFPQHAHDSTCRKSHIGTQACVCWNMLRQVGLNCIHIQTSTNVHVTHRLELNMHACTHMQIMRVCIHIHIYISVYDCMWNECRCVYIYI